ncbi:MAG: hypothetical protein ACP5UO_03775 [Thermoplasmata archaeon]
MLSRRSGIVITVVVLIIFSGLAVGTIEKSSSTLAASPSSASSKISLYSPSNGKMMPLTSPNDTIKLNLSVNTSASEVYIFPISPSSPVSVDGLQLLSVPNMMYLNKSSYPYNYEVASIRPNVNTTVEITLYVNSSAFEEMKISDPMKDEVYPYIEEILVETSGGASAIAFTVIRL